MNDFLKITFGDDRDVIRYKNRVMVLETLYTPMKHYLVIKSVRIIISKLKKFIKKNRENATVILIQCNTRRFIHENRFKKKVNATNIIKKYLDRYTMTIIKRDLEYIYRTLATTLSAMVIRRRFLKMKRACILIQENFRLSRKTKIKNYLKMVSKVKKMEEEKKTNDILMKKLQVQMNNIRRSNKRRLKQSN
tara:strand:+ start:122 stop:697 length:576 start_codon:yes stop_codon:yes gene_type:complete